MGATNPSAGRRRGRPNALVLNGLVLNALAATLVGCATPGPRTLSTAPAPAASVERLERDPARLPIAPLPKDAIDPSALTPLNVAVLAVLNSPELKAKRAAAGVQAAQVFAAGLLPDPQLGVSFDLPTPGQGAQTAYGVSPSLDLVALITRNAALKAAKGARRQADLDLLWAEWSAAQQARGLAETALADEAKARALEQLSRIAAERAAASRKALARGDLAIQTTSADQTTAIDAETQAAQARRDAAKARLDLDALIGLAPDVRLPLVEGRDNGWDPATVQAARAALATRRPDLLALQAGYAAQEAILRKSVLAQFPLLNLGFNRARDNTGIVSNGFSATFALPIFNGGRGQIAIDRATRDQLRAEYQARLDQTDAEVAADLAERAAARAQAAHLAQELPDLTTLAEAAAPAYRRGDLDSAAFVALSQILLTKTAELHDRRLAARLAEIALEAALFLPPAGAEVRP